MTDSNKEHPRGHASTSFRWHYGGKEGREVFDLETTIAGNPSEADLEAHVSSVIKAMGSVFRRGGRSHQRDPEKPGVTTTISAPAPSGPYHWITGRTGKPILVIQGNVSVPHEIECPIHAGAMMHLRKNEGGDWLTHKDGDTHCTARIERIPPRTD